jgi:16S rRNA C967 or C1407 C5-methylase (RsmB/RsmF family)
MKQLIWKNTGQVYLHDINSKKLEGAKDRMNKNKVQNVQFHNNLNAIKGGNKKFDIVLLDVPCSGKFP